MEEPQNNQNLPIYSPPVSDNPNIPDVVSQTETKSEVYPSEPPPEQPIQNQTQAVEKIQSTFPVQETPPPSSPSQPPADPLNQFEPEKKGFPVKIALVSLLVTIIIGAGAFFVLENQKSSTKTKKTASSYCQTVKVYDLKWVILSPTQLSELKPGDKVILAVKGETSSGSFDKARFKINGQLTEETAKRKADSGEFYVGYTVPEKVTNFQIDGEIHHNSLGWIN